MRQPLFPAPLKTNDLIGVMSTSCHVPPDDVAKAKKFMEDQGFRVFVHPQTFCKTHQSAGTAQEKADALHDLFKNPEIRAIFSSRGGNRASLMLPYLDFNLIRSNPKILIGYSDVTILLNAIAKQMGLTTFHGPLFRELPTHPDYAQMMDLLMGKTSSIDLSDCTMLRSANADAEGIIYGGNLSVFQGLIGTNLFPDLTNAILFLEDVGDHLSRYDRMFCHLRNCGALQNLSALIIGSFSETKDNEKNPFGLTLEDIILEHTEGTDYPILMNAPFGHDGRLVTLPIGAKAILKNGTLSFTSMA